MNFCFLFFFFPVNATSRLHYTPPHVFRQSYSIPVHYFWGKMYQLYGNTPPKKEADTHPGIAPPDTCPPVYFFILYYIIYVPCSPTSQQEPAHSGQPNSAPSPPVSRCPSVFFCISLSKNAVIKGQRNRVTTDAVAHCAVAMSTY